VIGENTLASHPVTASFDFFIIFVAIVKNLKTFPLF
jgi:hypothetical protein